MKVALVVNRIGSSISENIQQMLKYINDAADLNADLVLLPETATTGLINNDTRAHDLQLGTPIPGEVTDLFCEVARCRKINIAFGIFEREGDHLYDSAVFINRDGNIGMKYRRVSSGWHAPKASEYAKEGSEAAEYTCDFGKVCFLICGDLFEDDLVEEVKKFQPDYLLFPFARSFSDNSRSQEKWDQEEMEYYIERVKMIGATTLMVNYIDEFCFGGAFAILGDGRILGSLHLGEEGVLILDV